MMVGGCWWWLVVMLGRCCGCLFLLPLLDIEERVRENLTRQGRGERKKNHIQSYSNRAYMHGYYINFAYMQSYAKFYKHWCRLFYAILCKFLHILHFAPIGADALSVRLIPN